MSASFFKFDALKVIADYEHFVQMNLPRTLTIDSSKDLTSTLCDRSALASIVLKEVIFSVLNDKSEVRLQALNTLNFLFTKHDYDQRYRDEAKRTALSGIYVPFLLLVYFRKLKIRLWTIGRN